MIRHITFPEKPSAEILEKIIAAGEGFTLRILMRGTAEGTVRFLIDVVPKEGATFDDAGGCNPTDSSHVCPPQCP